LILSNNSSDKTKPYVKIIGNKKGIFDSPEWADLYSPDNHHRKIVRKVEPERFGLDVKDFILEH